MFANCRHIYEGCGEPGRKVFVGVLDMRRLIDDEENVESVGGGELFRSFSIVVQLNQVRGKNSCKYEL